jgi:chromosome segregation ATPase
MPGIIQRGRKRPSPVVSEDDEEQSDYPSSASVGSKRARHGHDASDSPAPTNGHAGGSKAYVEDEFQAGSLVRVKLTNFVTYTAAEFHLGPSLNMVIGPNGTGKSTLVCAICLGLGWGSENLGRAKDLGAFVKHGASEAVIEIELAAHPGEGPNPVVTRLIRKEDNKSIYYLNGKRSTQNAVTSMAKAYSIQIDNLCQFLPQDRVVEFARMTDVDRLRETQRAAAPAQMVEWHDQLKVLRSEERNVETNQKNEQAHLEKLEKQQNATRGDVERFHQREGLLQKSKCLKKAKPMIELTMRKKDLNQLKEDLRNARLELSQIVVDMEPAREAQTEVETYQSQIEQVLKLRRNRVEMIKTQADKLNTKIEKDQAKASEFTTEIKAELHSKKGREQNITRITRDIANLERQRQEEPVQYDAKSYDDRKTELRNQMSAISNQQIDRESSASDMRDRAHVINKEGAALKAQQENLNTQGGKQASLLQKQSSDTATAWAWIQKNRGSLQLKGEVFGPPLLECSIPDVRYAMAVESQLRKGDMVAITCTNGDDQKILANRLLSKPEQGGLGLHDVHLRTSTQPLNSYQRPVAPAALANYGFQGYMLDYINGPDAVLAMLCDNTRLHQIAYASTPITDQQHAAVSDSPIRTWVSGRETFRIVTRREYNASSTSVTKLRPAQWFIELPGNTDEIAALTTRITQKETEAGKLITDYKATREEIKNLRGEFQELKQARVRVADDASRLNTNTSSGSSASGTRCHEEGRG